MRLPGVMRFTALLLLPAIFSSSVCEAARKPPAPEAMKAKIVARGEGADVRVILVDKTEAKGQIVNIGAESFTLKLKNTPEPRRIEYAQITGVHRAKLSTEAKVAVYVVVVVAAVIVVVVVAVKNLETNL